MENFDYRSPYIKLANSELPWLPMDTEALYKENLKTNFKMLNDWGWIDYKEFSYKFNSDGFRSEEFDFNQTPSLVALGCSHTIGIGVPYEQTWPFLLSSMLDLKCYNLGIGGSSNDTGFRLGYHYVPKLKPSIVAFLSPQPERLEIVASHSGKDFNSWSFLPNSDNGKKFNFFYNSWIEYESNSFLNREKNILALKETCVRTNCLFVSIPIESIRTIDKARDLAHWGGKTNQFVAEKFYSTITKKIKFSVNKDKI